MKRILYLLAVFLTAHCAAFAQSNIKPGESYAWSESAGWINLLPSSADGVVVQSGYLSGKAWSEGSGWINFGNGTPADGLRYSNFDGSDFGVNLDDAGNLTGLAWSESLGWINFSWAPLASADRPRIDTSTGAFAGYAWSESGGWINLGAGLLKTLFTFPPPSDNADLANLVMSTGSLSPAFDSGGTSYTSDAAFGTSSVSLIPTAAHAGATIKVNTVSVVSGTASQSINLVSLSTPISIEVTAQDGVTTRTYNVSVNIADANKLFFASNVFTVVCGANPTAVDVVINRASSLPGTAGCVLNSTDGSAIAPAQYNAQAATPVSFADGVTQQHVLIPISANATTTSSKTFTVSLATPNAGSTLFGLTQAQIVILPVGTDVAKPVVNVASPTNAAIVVDSDPVTVTGTATDDIGVAKVQVSLDGITYLDAALANPNATSTTYTGSVTPAPGANTLRVRALDQKGNVSSIVTRPFTHMHTLAVAINGPANSGTVSSGYVPTSKRQLNKTYTILATPKTGFVFDGWTVNDMDGAGVTAAQAEQPLLTFKMVKGLVLVAKFIANPFTSAVTGNYSGLISPSPIAAPGSLVTAANNSTVGLCTATLSSTGALTGRLYIDGINVTFTAKCDNTGVARFGANKATTQSIPRTGKSPLVLALRADLNGSTKLLTGSLTETFLEDISAQSYIAAHRHAYSTSNPVPASYVKKYTARLKARDTQGEGFTSKDYPQGDGYLTFSVANTGVVTMVGSLADGTPVSMSGSLSQFNNWPIYQSLYTNKGCIAATAWLDDSQADTDATAYEMMWFRPAISTSQWYPYGWQEGILVDMLASKYTPAPAAVFPGLQLSHPTQGNTILSFDDGLLTAPVSKRVNLTTTNVLTKAPTTDTSFTFTPTFSTGLIGGTFTHTDGTKPAWKGVLMQKGGNTGGFGYFLSTKPATPDYKGESGKVIWSAISPN